MKEKNSKVAKFVGKVLDMTLRVEANTNSCIWAYQPEVPKEVKRYKKNYKKNK